MQESIRRTLKFMLIASVLTTGGAMFYERGFVESGIKSAGEIISFKRKQFSSAQGDSIEMEIRFTANGKQRTFYAGRNVIEQVMGIYKPGDVISVIYNPDRYPNAKIDNLQHLYKITLTFLIMWVLFFSALLYVWYKNTDRKSA